MAALMCAHKLTQMYTFTQQFVCTCCYSLNKCIHMHILHTHARATCFQENKIFCQAFCGFSAFPLVTPHCRQHGKDTDTAVCRGFILITLSGHQVDYSSYLVDTYFRHIYFYPLIFCSENIRLLWVINVLRKIRKVITKSISVEIYKKENTIK